MCWVKSRGRRVSQWVWLIGLIWLTGCTGERAVLVRLLGNPLPLQAAQTAPPSDGALTFGFDRRLEPREDVRMYASLLSWLSDRTGLPFRLHVTPRDGNLVGELCNGTVRFAAVGTVSYLQANHRCGVRMLVRGRNAEGTATYRAAIIVPPGSSLSDLRGLRGRSFAFGAPNSTQGHLIPRIMLQQAGLGLQDLAAHTYTGSHAATANAVTSSRYDAGGLQDSLAHALEARGLVRIIALSPPYPSSGIVVVPDVAPDTVAAVRAALLTLEPDGRDANTLYHWERSEMPRGFVTADETDYTDLHRLAREIGLLEP